MSSHKNKKWTTWEIFCAIATVVLLVLILLLPSPQPKSSPYSQNPVFLPVPSPIIEPVKLVKNYDVNFYARAYRLNKIKTQGVNQTIEGVPCLGVWIVLDPVGDSTAPQMAFLEENLSLTADILNDRTEGVKVSKKDGRLHVEFLDINSRPFFRSVLDPY